MALSDVIDGEVLLVGTCQRLSVAEGALPSVEAIA